MSVFLLLIIIHFVDSGKLGMESMAHRRRCFEIACRKAGLKLTPQRLGIYRELLTARDHPTAEALHRRLRTTLPTLSLDTVYRTLATLTHHGLISRLETKESLARFEAVVEPHHHLICCQCGKIVDFQWPAMEEISLPDEIRTWGRVDQKSVVLHGICQACLSESI
jgi:Fur family peroxide stress response transcriptional regulator